MADLWINVVIPYEPCKKLGYACNRIMEMSEDWVLILDHDVFLCTPNWYELCLKAITQVGHSAGWITGVCNRAALEEQRSCGSPDTDDLAEHLKWARHLWDSYGDTVEHLPGGREMTGFFILTHKEAWKKVGRFREDNFHIDGKYALDLIKAGYEMYKIPSLYCYHLEQKKKDVWSYNKWKMLGTPYKIL